MTTPPLPAPGPHADQHDTREALIGALCGVGSLLFGLGWLIGSLLLAHAIAR